MKKNLSRAEQVELKLTALIEKKYKLLEERIDTFDADYKKRFTEITNLHEENVGTTVSIQNTIQELSNELQQKSNKTDLHSYITKINHELQIVNKEVKESKDSIELYFNNKIQEHNDYFNKEIIKLNKYIKDINANIEIINSQSTNYLLKKEHEEYKSIVNANNQRLEDKIVALHNNINPYVLLVPDNYPDADALKNAPNNYLKGLFDEFNKEAKSLIGTQNSKLNYIETIIDMLKKNLNISVYAAAKKALMQLKAQGELSNSTKDKSTFDYLRTTINKKCDFSELQSLNDLKANKADLEILQQTINQINENIKYIVVLVNEFTGILTSNAKESKSEKITKLSYIAYQMTLFYKSLLVDQHSPSNENKPEERLLEEVPTIVINSSCKRTQKRSEVNHKSREKSFTRKTISRIYDKHDYRLNKSYHKKSSLYKTTNFRGFSRPKTQEMNNR